MQRDLVERAMRGDHDAFSVLAHASSDRLFGLARLVLGDSHTAQDALPEALILAWRDIRALREPDAWEAWLTRLTVRACYRIGEQCRRRTRVERNLLELDGTSGQEDERSVLDHDEIERGFRVLAPDQRAVMLLHLYLGDPGSGQQTCTARPCSMSGLGSTLARRCRPRSPPPGSVPGSPASVWCSCPQASPLPAHSPSRPRFGGR